MILNNLFDEFVSVRGSANAALYRNKLGKFLAVYGAYEVEAITPEIIKTWFDELEKGYSEGNLAMYRKCFAALFNSVRPHDNPVAGIRRYKQEPKRIIRADKDDVQIALDVCEQLSKSDNPIERRDAAIFTVGTSGARRSNIASLTIDEAQIGLSKLEQIGDDFGYILVCDGGKEKMELVLDERRGRIVRKYLEVRPNVRHDYLFVSFEENSYGRKLSNEGFIRARRKICGLANVEMISYQEMRRMVGTDIARQEGLETAAHALGHTSGIEVIRKHYYDPDKEKARKAALNVLKKRK